MSKLWKFRQKSGEHLVQIDTTQSKVGKAGLYSQTQNQSYEQDTEKRSLTKAHMDRNSKKKKKRLNEKIISTNITSDCPVLDMVGMITVILYAVQIH